jgi:hypothetical protein
MYNFVVVIVCFRFCQIIFVCKLLMFNCYQLYFEVVINSVNLYMYKFVCMNVDS